jgi:hypothetical protein
MSHSSEWSGTASNKINVVTTEKMIKCHGRCFSLKLSFKCNPRDNSNQDIRNRYKKYLVLKTGTLWHEQLPTGWLTVAVDSGAEE